MAAELRKHALILRQFARIGVIRKSQLRVEFFSQVVMDSIWYTLHVMVFEILFRQAPTIATWSHDDIRVFLGYLFVSDAFMMIWLGQGWHFGRDLKDGNLDTVRTRPASAIVLYFFKSFSLEGTLNMTIACSYLMYGVARSSAVHGARLLVLVPWGIAIAWWARIVLVVMFTIWEFYLVNSDMGQFMNDFLHAVEDRPLSIFERRVQTFFLFLLPVGAVSTLPASLVLGKMSVAWGLFHSVWLVAFGLLVFRVWNGSFRRYESAMS